MSWTRLQKEQTGQVISRIAQSDTVDISVFNSGATEVAIRKLPFYRNYKLYRLTNYASLPSFTMQFLSNDVEFHYLDGTSGTIYTVNERDPIIIDQFNAIDYIDFFFMNVQGTEGDIFIIKDPAKLPFINSFDEYQKKSIFENFKPLDVTADLHPGHYKVTGTLYYDGSLIGASIVVSPDGKLHFAEQHLLLQGIYFPFSPTAHMWVAGD